MGYALLDQPNPNGPHYYTRRKGSLVAFVQHITAGLQDYGMEGDDHSAEKVVRYAQTTTRAVSWHTSVDSDSVVELLPLNYTAFHCRGYNSRTAGQEISKRGTDWRSAPDDWVRRTLRNSAKAWAPKVKKYGMPLRHATRSEVDRSIAGDGRPVGFVGHFQLDPERRSDPGEVGTLDTFPWARLFGYIREELADYGTVDMRLPVLGLGSRGPAVEMVQLRLGVPVDGVFGTVTEKAVGDFHVKQGWPRGNQVGGDTWKALGMGVRIT